MITAQEIVQVVNDNFASVEELTRVLQAGKGTLEVREAKAALSALETQCTELTREINQQITDAQNNLASKQAALTAAVGE